MRFEVMYRIILSCRGVPAAEGPSAAVDITNEFANSRHWHQDVICRWDGNRLSICADNDFDSDGRALLDEFSDCLGAYIREPFDGEIRIEFVTPIAGNNSGV